MKFRVSPIWWPALTAASPVLAPWLAVQTYKFYQGARLAEETNNKRLSRALPLDLPVLRSVRITAVVEHAHRNGYLGDAAVSYLLKSELGSVLMDVGFGPERPALDRNCRLLGIAPGEWNELLVSHLHPDHMGGLRAVRRKTVRLPEGLLPKSPFPCYVPADCDAPGFDVRVIASPLILSCGLATTGPLARMLSLTGVTEEQSIVANLKGKGLVVVVGCGRPGIETILKMAGRMSCAPVDTIIGGLHFPITDSRVSGMGIEFQRIVGIAKPWWSSVNDRDLDETISALNRSKVRRLLLSAHDSCDHALDRLKREVRADVRVLEAGASYDL